MRAFAMVCACVCDVVAFYSTHINVQKAKRGHESLTRAPISCTLDCNDTFFFCLFFYRVS